MMPVRFGFASIGLVQAVRFGSANIIKSIKNFFVEIVLHYAFNLSSILKKSNLPLLEPRYEHQDIENLHCVLVCIFSFF